MDVTAAKLSESYYPADESEPILETTVGGICATRRRQAPT